MQRPARPVARMLALDFGDPLVARRLVHFHTMVAEQARDDGLAAALRELHFDRRVVGRGFDWVPAVAHGSPAP